MPDVHVVSLCLSLCLSVHLCVWAWERTHVRSTISGFKGQQGAVPGRSGSKASLPQL